MSISSQTPLNEEDYAAIEAAVMETGRGRWFLAEYARRNRNADTGAVLDAIGHLRAAMESTRAGGEIDRLRFDLVDMANAIARMRAEIAAIRPEGDQGHLTDASNELDAIVRSTEKATGDILAAAEHLQEIGWSLREAGVPGAASDVIEQRATDIYTACSFQDITGQRTRKVIGALRYIEDRLNAMMRIWQGAEPEAAPAPLPPEPPVLLAEPAAPDEALEQRDIDRMLAPRPTGANPSPAVTAEEPSPSPSPFSPPVRPRMVRSVEPPVFAESAAAVRPSAPLAVEPAAEVALFAPGEGEDWMEDVPLLRPAADAFPEEAPSQQAEAKPEPAAPRRHRGGPVRLADIEALSFEERAALFS